jgi:hypothetical protein
MSQITEHRRLAAIMFTHMVGYSAFAQHKKTSNIQHPTPNPEP